MRPLYEINQDILNCVTVEDNTTINTETGEVIDAERLDALHMEFNDKVRNIACFIKNLKAEAKAVKEEKEKLYARQKAAEDKADQLADYLQRILDGKKMKDTEYEITYRKSEAVSIVDETQIPEGYRIPQPDKLDKKAILDALKHDCDVPGAELVARQNMQIK